MWYTMFGFIFTATLLHSALPCCFCWVLNYLKPLPMWRAKPILRTLPASWRSHRVRAICSGSSGTKVLENFTEEFEIGSRIITLENGKIARFANGAVVLSMEDTKVLATVTSAKTDGSRDFLPLTVNYCTLSSLCSYTSICNSRNWSFLKMHIYIYFVVEIGWLSREAICTRHDSVDVHAEGRCSQGTGTLGWKNHWSSDSPFVSSWILPWGSGISS